MILLFGFGRRDVADGLKQPAIVEPVDPFERRAFNGLRAGPRPAPKDHLGPLQAIDGLGQAIVRAVADTANRWLDRCFGEPLDGQLAVAQVILNRVEDGRFGRSICAVVKAPKKFSFVHGRALPTPVEREQWKTAQAIASIALADAWHEIVPDATHFHATRVSPGWKMRRVASVGNHIFYR